MTDEWSGFADLLANLIEKYAGALELDDLPIPAPAAETVEKSLASPERK